MMRRKVRIDTSRCSVVGCSDQHIVLHRPPATEPTRSSWIDFIYRGKDNKPFKVPKTLFVCANHFTEDCFTNLRKFNEGFCSRLHLEEGSIPSIYPNDDHLYPIIVGTSHYPWYATTGCQTEITKMCTVGTQLCMKTLQSHFRSKGTQTTPQCANVGTSTADLECGQAVLTSKVMKRQSLGEGITPTKKAKRCCLEQTVAEDNPLEGRSTVDSDPEDKITLLYEIPDETPQPHPSTGAF